LRPRRRTIEWQVCGVCNYDCSYCIQSKKTRVGAPGDAEVESFLRFFAALPDRWEVKMTGGEPFAFKAFLGRIVPGLVAETPHTVSVLTNLSAPMAQLERFASLTRGRLGIVSASLHLEFTTAEEFADKATRLREVMDADATLVINGVLVPGRLDRVEAARQVLAARGLRFFPQLMKVKKGLAAYDDGDLVAVERLVGRRPSPREANLAPSYRGRLCHAGVDYFVLLQTGDAWRCRTSRRHDEGYLGNVHQGTFRRWGEAQRCTYAMCPCTVPANRGMIEGVAS
jgi:molybdenum cofactor biosynthesis enzyme MoaA